jgi:hypothetical protein
VDAIKAEHDQNFRYVEKAFKPNKPLPKNTEEFELYQQAISPAERRKIESTKNQFSQQAQEKK